MARIDQVLPKKTRKETIIQFGSGVFLRGFFDWMLQKLKRRGAVRRRRGRRAIHRLGVGDALTGRTASTPTSPAGWTGWRSRPST
jgi:hypothetical protein